MKSKITILLVVIIVANTFSQVQTSPKRKNGFWNAKEFSKDIALYNSKQFLFNEVFGISDEVEQFEIIPLAAASSGELTTLLYKCEKKKMEGLVLGFYGDYWNDAGALYQGYSYKNLEKDKAIEFLNKIENAIESNNKFMKEDNDNNNIYFEFDDMDVLIWTTSGSYKIRIFWKDYDSTWEQQSYERSKRRFERKINKK
jgi:hypothetical protein